MLILTNFDSFAINPFQLEAHICVPFSCYVIIFQPQWFIPFQPDKESNK